MMRPEERGRGIKELGGLKHLKGKLSIYNLEHVRDGEEAKEAKLEEKTNIRRLRFVWSANEDRSIPINNDNNDMDVLEGLKPHSALEILMIVNFSGDTFPPWMMCRVQFPCLEEMVLNHCPRLECIPITPVGLSSLRKLEISSCHELSSLPSGLQHCTSLEHLSIRHCQNLEAIPSLDSLTQLRQLEIYDCAGLKGVHPNAFVASLICLKELKIGEFWEELDSFPAFQVIPQLEILALMGWPKLKSLPEQVQHFTSLTYFLIWSFNGMEALPEWLGKLASLEYLHIVGCKNLMHLPSLEAMKCLTKLQYIRINHCPLLKERCNKYIGPEWPKISHIPNIEC